MLAKLNRGMSAIMLPLSSLLARIIDKAIPAVLYTLAVLSFLVALAGIANLVS